MKGYIKVDDHRRWLSKELEKENLLESEADPAAGRQSLLNRHPFLVPVLAISNIFLLLATVVLPLRAYQVGSPGDPSLLVYSPANEAVEYLEKQFDGTFFSKGNEYTGFPTDETDALWERLFNFGISVITPEEAAKLAIPTLPIPGTDDYLIELDVFHQLHCLNRIRKVFYPERYGDILHALMDADGNVNRSQNDFRHWDHCIDTIRQSLLCHADVSPLPFHIASPPPGAKGKSGIFPRLATRHTCRNFEKIQEWAIEHRAERFRHLLTAEEAQQMRETAGFDQGKVEELWMPSQTREKSGG